VTISRATRDPDGAAAPPALFELLEDAWRRLDAEAMVD
jgi:hypothetical protein